MVLNKLLKNSILFFIAFILIITASCKKYPDGPLLSLRTKEHRVIGEWYVEYFSVNGNDSTANLKSQPTYGTYIFKKEKGRTQFYYISNSRLYNAVGIWGFENHKSNIYIEMNHASHPWSYFNLVIFNSSQNTLWQIQRLTEKEMWLKGTYPDGREYFIKLKLKAK